MLVEDEGLKVVKADDGTLIAIIRKENGHKKHVIYLTEEATMDEVGKLIEGTFVQTKIPKTTQE